MEEVSCGTVIFRGGGGADMEREYLLLRYGWGHWGFVKGHTEEGEECTQTAMREAEEEAGLAKGWLKFVPGFDEKIDYFYTMDGKKMHKEVTYFLAECPMSTAVKLSREHTDYAWAPYDGAVKILTYENDKRVLKKAEEFLNKK